MKFTIPANAAAKPFKKHWKFCVGSGHAALAMRTDYCEQLKQIHDDLGIERVRFHGIFSDDMHTYDTMATVMPMPGAEQIPFYESSFRLPGLVYDNVLKAGMKPFVELSFMPSQMAKRPTRGTFYRRLAAKVGRASAAPTALATVAPAGISTGSPIRSPKAIIKPAAPPPTPTSSSGSNSVP